MLHATVTPIESPNFVSGDQLAAVFRVSRRTIAKWEEEGRIPRGIAISPRLKRWDLDVVLRAIRGEGQGE